jgi:hypothetical protein
MSPPPTLVPAMIQALRAAVTLKFAAWLRHLD